MRSATGIQMRVMGNAYCHIFAYVEEYIIPQALEAAQRDIYGDETRLRTLLRFAEDESKHQELFRRSTALFAKGFGVQCGLIPAREEVARVVLSKSRLCSYLLTSMDSSPCSVQESFSSRRYFARRPASRQNCDSLRSVMR